MKKYQLKKILDKIIKKKNKDSENECLSTSDFRIHWREGYDIRVPDFSKTNTNNFEDFQGLLHLYCFK